MEAPELGNPKVTYINRYDDPEPGPVSRVKTKLFGEKQHRRQDDQPFQTSISLSEIATFKDERVQEILWDQWRGEQEGSGLIRIPVIYFANNSLSHVIRVSRGRSDL